MKELMLVSLDGVSYGIWRESVLAVDAVKTSHRLSIARASIATLSVVGDHTETLADLAVCLGHPPTPVDGGAHVLRPPSGTGVSGFLVGGEITRIQADPDDCVPMPVFLRSPIVDMCAVHGSLPVPLINISALSARLLEGGRGEASPALTAPVVKGIDALEAPRFRIFRVGRCTCATACVEAQAEPLSLGQLARFPLLPPWVKGITVSRGRVLPVVDLARRLAEREAGEGCPVVVATMGAESFALLVDEDRGLWERSLSEVRDLPPIVRTPWMRSVAVNAGRMAAIIDPGALLSRSGDDAHEAPRPGVQSPDSEFPSQFGRMDLDVLEFSLLGWTQALPKSETEGTIPLGSLNEIAFSPKIVAGVAEHEGRILPVVDLARVFGQKLQADAGSPLILVKNGQFRALVMVEKVLGVRRIEREAQRVVPVVMPYQAVYGCYVDEKSVRLILNMQAITLHFDESEAGRLSPSLSPAIMRSAELQEPSQLDLPRLDLPRSQVHSSASDDRARSAELPASLVLSEEPFPGVASAQPVEELTLEEGIPEVEGPEPAATAPAGAVPAAAEPVPSEPESAPPESTEQVAAEPMAAEPPAAEPPAAEPLAAEPLAAEPESSEPGSSVPESAPPEPATELEDFAAPGESPVYAADSQMTTGLAPTPRARGRRTAFIVLGGLLVVGLAAAVLFGGFAGKAPPAQSPPASAAPVPAGQVQGEQAADSSQGQAAADTSQGQQLEIVVPAGSATNAEDYVVVKGDTLWSICERLTGKPFAYVRVAGENRIADPDLIFPGQRIRIVRK